MVGINLDFFTLVCYLNCKDVCKSMAREYDADEPITIMNVLRLKKDLLDLILQFEGDCESRKIQEVM